MKAFLKGGDGGLFQLSPKLTTVGRDGCDINLQTHGLDVQHAVIEYNEQEDCYVLQDLNTAQGTYVNDCRIQNAVVRLAPGDVIKFGYGGVPHELIIENPPPISYPPVQQRPAFTQPLTLLSETLGYTQSNTNAFGSTPTTQSNYNASLPYLATATATITIPSTVWTPNNDRLASMPRPPPPTLRARPLSAGSNRRMGSTYDRVTTVGGSPVNSPQMQRSVCMTNNWVNGRTVTPQQTVQNTDIQKIQEKEQKILQLTDECTRLRGVEVESFRKDAHIQTLQQTIMDMQQRMSTQPPLIMGQDVDLTQKLVQLEHELTAKQQEISALREQLLHQTDTNVSSVTEVTESKELNTMKNELERAKKDKNITSGLITQMQKDMSNKDSTISKLTREIEILKKEIRERDIQITAMSKKMSRTTDTPLKASEERDAREKELISLRQKFKATESKMQDQQELITQLKQELEKSKLSLYEEKNVQKKIQSEVDGAKAELIDLQRAERVVRVDLEQATKRLERFRNRVVQTAFATPGIKAPDGEISDDELLETLKKLIDERTEFHRKMSEMEQQLKLTDSSSNVFKRNMSKLRSELEQAVNNLKTGGFLAGTVKQEVALLQAVSGDESVIWMRDCLINLLNSAMTWEQNIESSLEACGVNIKLSNDSPGQHIKHLFAKWESAIKEKEKLQAQVSEIQEKFKADLEMQVKVVTEDGENKVKDALEKARIEAEEKLHKAIEEIKVIEAEKLENAVDQERAKIEQLETTINELKENIIKKDSSVEEKLAEASSALTELEEYKQREAELREQIEKLGQQNEEISSKNSSEINDREKKYEEDIEAYKEQNKQHSVTICAMEERLIKLMKKNKDYQEEITTLKKTIQDMKTEMLDMKNKPQVQHKPAPPPKPKVVQKTSEEFAAMEQLIVVLRKENSELKNKLQSQDDLILGLRRDLAGAHARLSDITGELSESQKQEIEKNKVLIVQKDKDIMEIRQQMAKLSKIIDKQKSDIKSLEIQLSEEKSISVKYKAVLDEKNQKIQQLEILLEREKQEQKKQLELLDQEGRITSEMTALGAQCRGERHEQVISRQREALSELRTRIRSLEQSKPPLPTQDQALQQVLMLKKELAEMKANQALAEDTSLSSGVEREVSRARGMLGSVNAEADMERSAHRETLDALDASESSYLTLLRALASCLELEHVDGLRPIGHIPKDERERLLIERENSCQLLSTRVKALHERIKRKEELLQGYERDLAKMRQAQELASKKATQVESLANDVKSRTEETQYLRESLSRTRDRLDQEKRLNKAIKQKKTFHLENEHLHKEIQPASYRSKPEDIFGKSVQRKKIAKESIKRKNYEINTLKKELAEKEETLYDTENRLYTIENSILKFLLPTHTGSSNCRWIFPITYGGGLVGGDTVEVKMEVRDGCCCLLTSQESTKIYHCEDEQVSCQTLRGKVGEGALLCVLPDYVVCYKEARYKQTQVFELTRTSNLVYLDWLTSGRMARQESWEFTSYHNNIDIMVDGELILRDNMELRDRPLLPMKEAMKNFQVRVIIDPSDCREKMQNFVTSQCFYLGLTSFEPRSNIEIAL
ncbi:hypothetical protein FSP39_005088 [Pinctada imbricata]|uniref:FHA domain-containing protein n=1 Tax=Pinctada imbricata TaxID=66713 RepID=A0AA88YSA5_PINIB|nr:hypothetical protein FSP39_005088 [Pinctada imbricata]